MPRKGQLSPLHVPNSQDIMQCPGHGRQDSHCLHDVPDYTWGTKPAPKASLPELVRSSPLEHLSLWASCSKGWGLQPGYNSSRLHFWSSLYFSRCSHWFQCEMSPPRLFSICSYAFIMRVTILQPILQFLRYTVWHWKYLLATCHCSSTVEDELILLDLDLPCSS